MFRVLVICCIAAFVASAAVRSTGLLFFRLRQESRAMHARLAFGLASRNHNQCDITSAGSTAGDSYNPGCERKRTLRGRRLSMCTRGIAGLAGLNTSPFNSANLFK